MRGKLVWEFAWTTPDVMCEGSALAVVAGVGGGARVSTRRRAATAGEGQERPARPLARASYSRGGQLSPSRGGGQRGAEGGRARRRPRPPGAGAPVGRGRESGVAGRRAHGRDPCAPDAAGAPEPAAAGAARRAGGCWRRGRRKGTCRGGAARRRAAVAAGVPGGVSEEGVGGAGRGGGAVGGRAG